MEPALKHRLIGAAVLSALAIIFLPMLIVAKDPNDTVSRVPLKVPDAPPGNFQTRELPLVGPASATPDGGVVGMDTRQPAAPVPTPAATTTPQGAEVATSSSASGDAVAPSPLASPTASQPTASPQSSPVPAPAAVPPSKAAVSAVPVKPVATPPSVASPAVAGDAPSGPIPAAQSGGHYVVSLGTYSNAANAQSLVASLKSRQLPAYAESVTLSGKSATRVRIGPFQQRGDAEAARLKAQQVRSDMPANVTALDAATPAPEVPAAAVAPKAAISASAKPSSMTVAPSKPIAQPPPASGKLPTSATVSAANARTSAPSPAAAGRGYAVQVSAFGTENEANVLRNKLRAAGFVSYSEKVQTESGTRWRVRVGPEADRDGADHLRAELSTKMNLSGMVVAYP